MKKIIDQIREITGARKIENDSVKGFGDHIPNFVEETLNTLKTFNEFRTKKPKRVV